jgi:queuosine precursor transporter
MSILKIEEKNKLNNIFIILTGIFITNAIIAEILGTKIFDFSFLKNFSLSVGVLIWPVVFITTDIINEYFGKSGVKKISYFTIILILYVFLIVFLSTKLTPNTYWLNINSTDNSGNPFDIDYAYNSIFLQSTGIIIGSVFAFLIAQLLDVFIFQKIKKITKGKFIWLRATGSTLISQLIDSFVVLTIAFYFLAPEGKEWSINQVFVVGFDNYTFKFFVAIIITPFIYLAHYLIDSYLGKDLAEKAKEQALKD